MANYNQMIHDARTGFHDITALPEFHPSLISLQMVLLCAIATALTVLIFIVKKDRRTLIPPPPPPDPSAIALNKLEEIRSKHDSSSFNLRELAAQISLILRIYYNDAYNFPADDRTEQEIKNELTILLPKTIPALSKETYSTLITSTSAILSQCEFISFSDIAEKEYYTNPALFLKIIDDAKELIIHLNQLIRHEHEHLQSILDNNLETELQTE